MTGLYTLVLANNPGGVTLLIGSPKDGDQAAIDAAIASHREMEQEYRMEGDDDDPGRHAEGAEIELVPHCVLTDEEPDDEDSIVYWGHECGWLIDEHGESFKYALKAAG